MCIFSCFHESKGPEMLHLERRTSIKDNNQNLAWSAGCCCASNDEFVQLFLFTSSKLVVAFPAIRCSNIILHIGLKFSIPDCGHRYPACVRVRACVPVPVCGALVPPRGPGMNCNQLKYLLVSSRVIIRFF